MATTSATNPDDVEVGITKYDNTDEIEELNSKIPSKQSVESRVPSKDLLGFPSTKAQEEKPKKAPGRIDEVHSLRVIAIAAGLLCLNSGWVNAIAFRGFDGGITHVTGTSTGVGINLAAGNMQLFLRSTAKILCFMFGAMISGGYLGRKRLFKGGPRYAQLLLLVSALMYGAFAAEKLQQNFLGALLLAMSSGVQNALTTLYSGAVARTTHVTGTATDMGIEIGMYLFQKDSSGLWKLKLFCVFLFCYIFGGFLGAVCFRPDAISGVDFVGAEAQALLVPATVTFAIASAWLLSLSYAEPDPSGYGFYAELTTFRSPEDKLKRKNSLQRRNSIQLLGLGAGAA